MQNEDRNEIRKPESSPKDPEPKKELSDEELASIAAGRAFIRREAGGGETGRMVK